MEHARHRLPGALRLLQSFLGHLDNELVAACSPLDSRDAPDVVLALVLQLLENREELAGDLELVIGVNPHPRRVDVARFGCDLSAALRTRALYHRWQHATARSKCS